MIRFCDQVLLFLEQRRGEGRSAKQKTGGDANVLGGIEGTSAETLELRAHNFLEKVAKKP